jgi:hypothetical protein
MVFTKWHWMRDDTRGVWLVSLALMMASGYASAQIATPAVAPKATPSVAIGSAGVAQELDFVALLREMRGALKEVISQRENVKKHGDKLKESCLYERQRAIAQAVDSTETAQVAWEAAVKQGESGKARAQTEQARAQKAIELVRTLRSAAEDCVGEELREASRPTTVTANGPGALDDPLAGPAESLNANLIRLELPSRPNPASAYHPTR